MGNKIPKFKAQGFLKKSYFDKFGGKHVTLEFSAKDSLEIARLELMGRDHINHLPVLLTVEVSIAKEKNKKEKACGGLDEIQEQKKEMPGRRRAFV